MDFNDTYTRHNMQITFIVELIVTYMQPKKGVSKCNVQETALKLMKVQTIQPISCFPSRKLPFKLF